MKNKFLLFSILTIIAVLSAGHVMGQNSNNTGASEKVQQQAQTVNQGQVQVQAQVQVQVNNEDAVEVNSGMQVQQQQQLHTDSQVGEQVQDQNQVQNQGEENMLQNSKQQEMQSKNIKAEQRKSQVANAVQEILQVAERNSGIGEQVRVIAQVQNQNQEKLEESLQKVQNRNSFTKFLIGVNYSEIKNASRVLEESREQIQQLNEIKNQFASQEDQEILNQQIEIFEETSLQIENSLNVSQKGFSLLGWLFKWLVR